MQIKKFNLGGMLPTFVNTGLQAYNMFQQSKVNRELEKMQEASRLRADAIYNKNSGIADADYTRLFSRRNADFYLANGGLMPVSPTANMAVGDPHGVDSDNDGREGVPVGEAELEDGEIEVDGMVFSKRLGFADKALKIINTPQYKEYEKVRGQNELVMADKRKSVLSGNTASRNLQKLINPLLSIFQEQEMFKQQMGLTNPNNPTPKPNPSQTTDNTQKPFGKMPFGGSLYNVPSFAPQNANFGYDVLHNYTYNFKKDVNNIPNYYSAEQVFARNSGLPNYTHNFKKDINNEASTPLGIFNSLGNVKEPLLNNSYSLVNNNFRSPLGGVDSVNKQRQLDEIAVTDKQPKSGFNINVGGLGSFYNKDLSQLSRFGDNVANLRLMKPPKAPQASLLNSPRLESNFDINANLAENRSTLSNVNTAIGRSNNLAAQGLAAASVSSMFKNNNQLFTTKTNAETQLRNQNELQRLSVEKDNNQIRLTNDMANYQNKLLAQQRASANAANLGDDISMLLKDKNLSQSDRDQLILIMKTLNTGGVLDRTMLESLKSIDRPAYDAYMKATEKDN